MVGLRYVLGVVLLGSVIPMASADSVITGEGSTFVMSYDSIYDSAKQTVMNNAAQFWADSVRSTVPIKVHVGTENKTCSFASNSHVKSQLPDAVMNFANAPVTNVYYPVALANSLAGADLKPSDVDINIVYNGKIITRSNCQKWYLGYDANYTYMQYSLYFETLQEIAHGLGLVPLGNLMTGQKLNGYDDVFWSQLKSAKTGKFIKDMSPSEINTTSHDSLNLAFAGLKTWAASSHLTSSRVSDSILMFARSYDALDLTGSHFHENTDPMQLMMVDLHGGVPETELAVVMLEDLGWQTTRNDAPVITGQQSITINEDAQHSVTLADLTITDEDTASLTLNLQAGANYQLSGNQVIPSANYYGTLSVPVTVSDAEYTSAVFSLTINVTAQNDAPAITAQSSLQTNEDASLALSTSHFSIADVDSSSFTLNVLAGTNYSVVNKTVTPSANFSGTLTVPVQVSDGALLSAIFNTTVTVNAVNDAPVITAQTTLQTNEDASIALSTSHFSIADVDSSSFTLNVLAGTNYSVVNKTVTPSANFSGTLTVPVQVSDGALLSAVFNTTVTVNAVNDAPVITAQSSLQTNEDVSLALSTSHFSIADVDSSSFTLNVLAGTNYSVVNKTVTPSANFSGTLTVPVQVSDGALLSAVFNTTVTVNAVNDAPVITAQSSLQTDEDTSLALSTSHFSIADVDSSSFTLSVLAGTNYSVVNKTVTPLANFSGTLTVPVQVSDGALTSAVFNATVTVNAINDAPVITAQSTLQTDEDTSLALSTSHFSIADVDSSSFTLNVLAGTNYTLANNTVTPASNYSGELTVPVQVSDGSLLSPVFNATVTVANQNDAPIITAQSNLQTNEDTSIALTTSQFSIEDIDSSTFTLNVLAGTHYTVVNNTVSPSANFAGQLTVPVQVSDGALLSPVFNTTITVNAVNDAPVITGQITTTVLEDNAVGITTSMLSISDVDSSSFSLSFAPGSNYVVAGNTVAPAANFSGVLNVGVQVSDGQLTSTWFNFVITVTAQNDAPVITAVLIPDVNEDESITLTNTMLSVTDPDNASFTISVLPGSHYQVAGLVVTPDADYNGTLQVPLQVNDGNLNSATYTTLVNVLAVNDAPVITGQNTANTLEETALVITPELLLITDVDSSQFTLTVNTGNNYTVQGNTITPELNYNGTLAVPVSVSDGQAGSNTYSLLVTVLPQNDAPVLTGQTAIQTLEDQTITLQPNMFTFTDVDSTTFTVFASAGSNYTVAGSQITPAENFFGTLTIPVQVSDTLTLSNTMNVTVDVVAVNDAPVIINIAPQTIDEDSSFTYTQAHLTITDPDDTVFTVMVQAGVNYTVVDNEITPNQNFVGQLHVPIKVSDGDEYCAEFIATVNVINVNDAPIITGQVELSTAEETSLTLSTDMLTAEDVDSTEFTLSVLPGAQYSVNDTTILPNTNVNGFIAVNVQVSDGLLLSNIFELMVDVIGVNDAPVLTGQSDININEEQPLMLTPALLTFSDVDSSTFTVVASSGLNYTVSNGQLMPAIDFNGTLTVPMQISDSMSLSNTLDVTINVLPVNDTPVLVKITPQTIIEDSSLFVSKEIMSIDDPDNTEFTISITAGEHYQVAGNEIIPSPNWFGELTINMLVNDGLADSNTLPLLLTVAEVNDLPELTTQLLPSSQIYRDYATQLTATDIDGDALTYSLASGPSWLSLSESGELTMLPDHTMTGDHIIEIAVSDGRSTVAFERILTVLDDETATNLSVATDIERTIWSNDGWVPVSVTLNNLGPKASASATVTIQFAGEWTTEDARCNVANNQCHLELTSSEQIDFTIRQAEIGSSDLLLTVQHPGFEISDEDNSERITLTFTDGNPTSPQFTVPAFGQGTVRAIAVTNIQGGRWPEIIFANGPTEASTTYRFERSLFRPVLHSHLGDASDTYGMALFDADNDGDKDWVLANGGTEANSIYLNDGEGHFTLVDLLGNYNSRAVAFGDIDRDGDKDLVFANYNDPNTLYLNNGDGTYTFFAELGRWRSRCVIIHDFNRDGRPDILFANRGFRNSIFFNRGIGNSNGNASRSLTRSFTRTSEGSLPDTGFSFDETEIGNADDLTEQVTLADFDGDGIASDIVFVNEADESQDASMQVFTIADNEQSTLIAEADTGSVTDVSVGDYDGDGRDDLAVLRPGGALEVMQPASNTLKTIEVMDTDGADTILMVDVDGSGQADIISANNTSETSRLDFAGSVTDIEATDEGTTVPVVLPETPEPAAPTSNFRPVSSKGGAGLTWLLLGLLLIPRKKYPNRH